MFDELVGFFFFFHWCSKTEVSDRNCVAKSSSCVTSLTPSLFWCAEQKMLFHIVVGRSLCFTVWWTVNVVTH